MPANLRCAQAKGMPMMVTASRNAVKRWPSASHQPASTSQSRLAMPPIGLVERVGRLLRPTLAEKHLRPARGLKLPEACSISWEFSNVAAKLPDADTRLQYRAVT